MAQKRFSQISDIFFHLFFSHFSDSTLRFMVKFYFKFSSQPNGKRYPKSEETVFVSCITKQHCEISEKSGQGLMNFEGFYQNMNSGEMRRIMAI